MSAYSQRRGIKVIHGTGENLPVRTSSFDFAIIVTTICFLDDASKAVREAARIIRPGGCIIIGMVNKASQLGHLYNNNKNDNVFYRDAVFYSVDEVVDILTQSGFRQFSFTQTIFNSLENIKSIEPATEGFDKGSFIGIKGVKSAC